MKIRILVFDGVDELDVIGPYEVFRHVAMYNKDLDLDVTLVTLNAQSEIRGHHGLTFRSEGILEDDSDLVIIPGGGWVNQSNKGIRKEIEQGVLVQRIALLHSKGVILAGVCTGALALAAAGLLKGREATTHQCALHDLHQMGAEVAGARIVDCDDILTCGGVTSAVDLSLWIVERFFGMKIASSIADYLEHPRSSDIYISKNQVVR